FHNVLESAYPIHVAVSVVELALWVLSHTTMHCNTSIGSTKFIPDSSGRRSESSFLINWAPAFAGATNL
ncbi:MAG TPA: hypothetical protein VFW53_02470, partial [Gallionella sp.]|nr:hypothetical protein [Gallionella sp.]